MSRITGVLKLYGEDDAVMTAVFIFFSDFLFLRLDL